MQRDAHGRRCESSKLTAHLLPLAQCLARVWQATRTSALASATQCQCKHLRQLLHRACSASITCPNIIARLCRPTRKDLHTRLLLRVRRVHHACLVLLILRFRRTRQVLLPRMLLRQRPVLTTRPVAGMFHLACPLSMMQSVHETAHQLATRTANTRTHRLRCQSTTATYS